MWALNFKWEELSCKLCIPRIQYTVSDQCLNIVAQNGHIVIHIVIPPVAMLLDEITACLFSIHMTEHYLWASEKKHKLLKFLPTASFLFAPHPCTPRATTITTRHLCFNESHAKVPAIHFIIFFSFISKFSSPEFSGICPLMTSFVTVVYFSYLLSSGQTAKLIHFNLTL